jgi:outer membrane protein OmpU
MTNIKKLGLTALAGSLVAVSAHAGEMSVSGSAIATYKTGGSDDSANTLGANTNITFSGSGELDNGYTVDTFVVYKDDVSALSSSALTVTMGSMGTIGVSTGGGFNINGAYDETYPRAYEENSDAGGDSSANYVGNWADDNAIIYKAPAIEIAGATVNVGAEYSLQAGTATSKDGGSAARSATYDTGYGVGVTVAYEGLTLGAYGAERENRNGTGSGEISDEFNGSWFVNYSMGPVAIGYQETYVDAGLASNANDYVTTSAKTVGTSGGIFDSQSMSIAFNVNDDLSISYSETEDTYDAQSDLASTETADVTQESDSFQIAYSMGAMSIKAYSTEITNPRYDSNAATLNVNEIALGLAF